MNLKQLLLKTYRESKKDGITDKIRVFRLIFSIYKKNLHKNAEKYAAILIKRGNNIGYYYMSELKFLYADYTGAYESISHFLSDRPFHPDAVYLQVKILQMLNKIEPAWEALENLLYHSNRLKTWLIIANLVESEKNFERLMKIYENISQIKPEVKVNRVVKEYLSIAALRAQRYEDARRFWREIVLMNSSVISETKTKFLHAKKFSIPNAATALAELSDLFENAGIEMFLVSGTFLGCIREGKLLSHDKDIDVGIWENVSREKLLETISSSGTFYVQASRSPHIIRLSHLSGVAIDVFYHYREGETFWHGGVKARWYNRIFDLTSYTFLGREYLGPKDYDLYLRENYGDWKIPKKNFDNVLDTPNAQVINDDEMAIHLFRLLTKKYAINNRQRILDELKRYGESEFVEKY